MTPSLAARQYGGRHIVFGITREPVALAWKQYNVLDSFLLSDPRHQIIEIRQVN